MVKIILGNITSRIVGYLPPEVGNELDKVLSYKVAQARYIPMVKRKQWDGVFHLYQKSKGQSFYSGLLSLVVKVLEKHQIEYEKVDSRIRPEINLPHLTFSPPSHYEERPYQQFTIERALSRTRGVLKMATGAGKTIVVSEIISKIKTAPFMFYVLTEDLLEQAYDTLSTVLNEPIGKIGGGKFDVKNINVCTIQTAVRAVNLGNTKFKISDYQFDDEDVWDKKNIESEEKLKRLKSLLNETKGIYFDEVHHATARTCKDVLIASPNAFWKFGGSATPFREDGAEIMIQAMFGKKIVDVTASYLIDKGFLIEPYILFVPWKHDVDLEAWKSIYSECIVNNNAFNTHVADTARYLMENGLSTLVLVQQYAQGDFIKSLLPGVEFITGKMSGTNRKQAIQDLRDKKTLCLIATTLADEGLDVPTLDAALLAGGGASSTRVHQRIGRTLRVSRDYHFRDRSIVVYYDHDAKYLKKHSQKARKIIAAEPRFNIVDSVGAWNVKNEISGIMNLKGHTKTIFDV